VTIKAWCVAEGADRPTVATFIGLHHAAVAIISDSTAIVPVPACESGQSPEKINDNRTLGIRSKEI